MRLQHSVQIVNMDRCLLLLCVLALVGTCLGGAKYTRTVSYEGEVLVKW